MSRPLFRPVRAAVREEAEAALAGSDPSVVNPTLFDLAFHDPDWRWVQEQCIRLSSHPIWNIRAAAATALGHLARIHGQADLDHVLPILLRLAQEPTDAAHSAKNALTDIRQFVPGADRRLAAPERSGADGI